MARELTAPQTARTAHNWQVIARLANPSTLQAARTELSGISRSLKARYGDTTWMSDATAIPLREQLTAATRPVLLMLFGAAVLLLVVACLNVSNLQLARASARRREIAVRLAVGAGRGRITRQLLAEAVVLSAAAAALGIVIALIGVRALAVLQPGNLPRIQNVQVDWTVMLFAIGVALLTAVALGVVTAARASKQEIRETLTEGTRSVAGGRASERVRQGLAVAQVALTIVLLIGAGLLTRSFVRLLAIDPGFRTDDALVIDLSWPFDRDAGIRQRRVVSQQDDPRAPRGAAGRAERRAGEPVSPRDGKLRQRAVSRDDTPGRDPELRRSRTARRRVEEPGGLRRLSNGERRIFHDHGDSAGARTAVRRARRPRCASRRRHQRVARRGQVAEPGSAGALHPVRQHGRRSSRLHRDRHRRRRARELARDGTRPALLLRTTGSA